MRPLGRAQIQSDCCSYEKGRLDTCTQRDNHVRTQGGDHLQDKEVSREASLPAL